MRFNGWLGAVAVLGLSVVGSGARADEEKIGVKDLPKAVADAVKAKFPGAEMKGAAKEEEDGKTVYEVSFTYQGSSYDVGASPDGTILEVEKTISPKELPAAVLQSARAKYPKGKIEGAETVTKGGVVTYEVVIETADDKEFELVMDASGKILKTEAKAEEDDEKDEKNEKKD